MKEGLEGVVEFLLPELAFAGEQGLTVDEFLVLVKLYFKGGKKAVEGHQRGAGTDGEAKSSPSLNEAELSFARGAWKWLVARPNVVVGGNRRYNKLALDDILALPDPNKPVEDATKPAEGEPATKEASSSTSKGPVSKPQGQKSKSGLSARPLLYVTEETIWRAIAGHGVDYKRIPKLEWQLLQVIAQTKHEGILQGELRQKSGQDKRSVPKRTDFLAAKGYIAKRSIMVRKSKTSKLWLASLAPSTAETTKESLATNYDMSKAALTRDLSPVPWHTKWTGTDIDVETFAESIVIICKAWGVIRYADMRLKMGVEELRWQMRVMARLVRNLVDMGLLRYTAATFSNQKKVWKDCIKFLRDPTESEWAQILATGKKTSKYSDLTKDRQPKPLALSMTNTPAEASQTPAAKEGEQMVVGAPPAQLVSRGAVGWVPEKPLAHTLFDTIEAAGPGGASNPQISAATVGYNFRRYIGTMLTNIATCRQPPHLRKFQINRELVRRDKTTTFIYTAGSTTSAGVEPTQDVPETAQQPEVAAGEALDASGAASSVPLPVSQASPYGFGPIQPGKVAESAATLSDVSKRLKGRNRSSTMPKKTRNREPFATPAQDPEGPSAKRRKLDNGGDGTSTPGATVEEVVQPKGSFMPGCAFEFLPGKPDGVYKGEPNSLRKQRGGRPKKSVVLIFRSEKMKNEGFWVPRMPLGPQEVSLRVKYQGTNGELRLHKGTKLVTFFSRPALPEMDVPVIDLDGLRDDPFLQTGTEEEDSAIVFVTKENGETPSKTYTFVVKKDAGTQGEAAHVLEQIQLILHPPPAPEEPTVTGTQEKETTAVDADVSVATEAAATEEPAAPKTTTRAKGKKKGIRKRDIKCWKCDKCGGTWKNDIGLKYHLEKAQVPCNPNFVAAPPMPKKKRRRSVTPPPTILQNRTASEVPEADMGTGEGSSARPVRRAAAAAGRTEEGDEDEEPQVNVIMPRRRGPKPRYVPRLYDAGTPTFRGLTVDPTITDPGQQEVTPMRERPPRPTEVVEYIAGPGVLLAPSRPPIATPVASMTDVLSTPQLNETTQPTASSEPVTEKTATPAAPVAEPTFTPGLTPAPEDKGPGEGDGDEAANDVSDTVTDKPMTGKERTALPTERPEVARKYPAFKPGEYIHHHTESKMRTAQCSDIIEYLLDCNGGVFPGDKALFFAMLKVFLQSFPDQTPPSLRSCSAAVRRLNSKNKAREIVHAFRHKGKFVTCNMLVCTDIDVKDEGPTALKRKMQDAFPKVYIPASFSPTEEELQIIDQIDPKNIAESQPHLHNTEKFRKRREEIEVEVLDAPFYQDHPGHLPRQFLNANDTPENRRKRRTNAEMAAAEAEPPAKRKKTIGTKMLKNADEAGDEVEEVEEGVDWDAQQPDIAGAIKQFGLLPTQRGGKPRLLRVVAVMNKLDPTVGRLQNPGLDSLPATFFSNDAAKTEPEVEVNLQFLPPNTRLEDSCDWFEDAFISENAQDPSLLTTTTYEIIMPPKGALEQPVTYRFTNSCITLHEYSPGIWPGKVDFPVSQSVKYEDGNSFTMQGWFPDHQWILRQSLPTDVNHMVSMVKGRIVDPLKYQDPAYGAFCDTVDRCARWEQSEGGVSIMASGTVAPNFIYINFGTPYGKVKQAPFFDLEWSDETQFTVDTLPYADLKAMKDIDDDDEDGSKKLAATLLKRPRGRPKTKTPKTPAERKPMGRRPKKNRLPAIAKQRAHTAYPQSQEAYMEVHRGEDRTKEWNSEHTQLAAFVCITTLLGGVSKAVDWGLMMRLFPDVSLSHLRKFWGDLNKDRKSTIIDLTEKFQKAFLAAYEKGEVPPLNYDSYIDYDWVFLVNWTKGLAGTISDLPASYDQLDKNGLVVSDQTYQPRDWRETFWVPNRSLYNRFQDASSQAISMPLEPAQPESSKNPDDHPLLPVAQSWVRALCVTDRTHSEHVISNRWASFMGLPRDEISDLINDAVQRLQDAYVITKDKGPSTIRLNDRVVKLLDKASQELKFAEAAAFKRRLDKTFRKGKKHRVRYQADKDGHTLALLNLQAHGRVKLETENKFVPLGYVPYNYETRKYNKKHHHFRLYAVPTDTYLYSTENELQQMPEGPPKQLINLLSLIETTLPPNEGPDGELPIWCDFLGVVDEHRWRKCLGAVLFLLSVRGPMRAAAASEQLKFLMPFEVQLVLDWADGLGLMRQMTPEAPKSLTEWWWLAVDTQRRRVEGDKGKAVVGDVQEGEGDEMVV